MKFFLLPIIVVLCASTLFADDTYFEKKWSIRGLVDYNYFSQSTEGYDKTLRSNRPVEIGLGLGYKDFVLDFRYALPFTAGSDKNSSKSFDLASSFFPKNLWVDAWLNICSGFNAGGQDTTDITDTIVSLDLTLVNYGAKVLYITNPLHTPRAPYFLDRRQKTSGYSFMVGGSIQRTRLRSRDSILNFNNRFVDYIGPVEGVSYTYLFANSLYFVNVTGLLGEYLSYQEQKGKFGYAQNASIKAAYGYIGDNWAWNITLGYEATIGFINQETQTHGFFKILGIRRF